MRFCPGCARPRSRPDGCDHCGYVDRRRDVPPVVWLIAALLGAQLFLTVVIAVASVAAANAGQEMGQGIGRIACELNRAYC